MMILTARRALAWILTELTLKMFYLKEKKKNYDVLVLVKEYCLLCMGGVVCGGLGGRWGVSWVKKPSLLF